MSPGEAFRPDARPHENGIVDILAFSVLDNHFHLALEAEDLSYVSKFCQRLGTSLTVRWQRSTGATGRLLESNYRMRVAKDEYDSRVIFSYVSVINAAEGAGANRDSASTDELIAAAMSYKFGSLPDHYSGRRLPIAKKDRFLRAFPNLDALREFVLTRPRPTPELDPGQGLALAWV